MNSVLRQKAGGGAILGFAAAVLLALVAPTSAQTPAGVSATQASPLYFAGATQDVSCAFAFPAGRNLQSLLWTPDLPDGWTLLSVTGDGAPEIDTQGAITFFGVLSANPVRFSYRVVVPAGTTGPRELGGRADYQLDGMFNPNPLAVQTITLSEVAATHEVRGYLAGHRLDVTCTFAYRAERQLQSLMWIPELPSGWTLVDASGQGSPQVDNENRTITLFGDLSANPVTFQYTVEVPSSAAGTNYLGGSAEYQLNGMFNPGATRALPDPLGVLEMHTLQIASPYGAGLPAVGVYTNFHGTTLTNRNVTGSVTIGSRTFACSGWSLAGNSPLTGIDTNCVLTLTNNAVLTWVWVAPLISPAGMVTNVMDEDNTPIAWSLPAISAITTSDPTGQPAGALAWSLLRGPTNGTATVSGTGATPAISYVPATNYYGSDSFVVRVTDGLGGFDQVTVNVTVNPINDPPVLAPIGARQTDEFTPLTFRVLATDVDIPAQTLTYTMTGAPTNAALDPATGVFTWTPFAGQAGVDAAVFNVTVTVTDNGTAPAAQSDSETFMITLDSSRATHATVGYLAGQTLTIHCTFAYPAGRELQSLLWRPELPEDWTLESASGDGAPDIDPFDGSLVLVGADLPMHNPVTFSYVVRVPVGVTGRQEIGGLIEYQMNGMANPAKVRAQPDPLFIPMLLTLPDLDVSDKVYDGLTNATIMAFGTLAGVMPGHDVTLVTTGAVAYFDTPQAGPGKPVTVSGLLLAGINASWYAIDTHVVTAAVSRAGLTIGGSFAVANKFYDGTIVARISVTNLTLVGAITGDDISLLPVASFDDKNVGADKLVSLTSLSSLTGLSAGNYTLSLAGAPTTTADILFPAVSAAHACAGGYSSPSLGKTSISNSFAYPAGENLISLTWTPILPANWTVYAVTGDGSPSTDGTNIVFAAPSTAANPLVFRYTLGIPGGQSPTNYVRANVTFGLSSMADTLTTQALPESLLLKRYHSADYQTSLAIQVPNGKIDTFEMQRLLKYWRNGTGEYHVTNVTPTTPDGYDVGSVGVNPWYHSADYQTSLVNQVPDGRIDIFEMQRVLKYWRNGVGEYHNTNVTTKTPDGYDVGP
jgi:hypothetical protein